MTRRTVTVLTAVTLALSLSATGCVKAQAGAQCRSTDWGDDGSSVLRCERGRWVRKATKAQVTELIVTLLRARQTTQTGFPAQPSVPGQNVTFGPGPAVNPDYYLKADTIQAIHVLTADGVDNPTVTQAIALDATLIDDWFAGQNDGRRLRWVRNGPAISVVTVRVSQTRAQLDSQQHSAVFDGLGPLMVAAGVVTRGRISLVWIDAGVPGSWPCGEGSAYQLNSLSSGLAVNYMASCGIRPGMWNGGIPYLMVHELTHALGAVEGAPPQGCAPHRNGGHVGDDPRDVIYEGTTGRDWDNLMLDPGHDDYFKLGANPLGCRDLAAHPAWM